MTSIIARQAKSTDLGGTRELLERCGLPAEGLDYQYGERYCVFVEGSQIVGAGDIEVSGRFGLLRSVAVLPRLQGKRFD